MRDEAFKAKPKAQSARYFFRASRKLKVTSLFFFLFSFFFLLLAACTDQPPLPPPTPQEAGIPAPSTPNPVITIQGGLPEGNIELPVAPAPILEEAKPEPTRPPAPAPKLSAQLPDLSTLPVPTSDPVTARLLTRLNGQHRTSDGKLEPIRALAFSPDRKYLAVSDRSEIWVVELATGRIVQNLYATAYNADERGAHSLDWSPDGQLLAAGGLSGVITMYRWDRPNQQFRGSNRLSSNALALAEAFGDTVEVAFSPDGKLLAGFGTDGTINLYNSDFGRVQYSFASDYAGYVTWSPDGKRVADEFFLLHYLDKVQSAYPNYAVSIGGDGPQGIAWSPNGQWLAASGDAFELLLVEAPTPSTPGQPAAGVVQVVKRVGLRNPNTGSATGATTMPHLKEGRRVVWSPGSRWVAVANVPEIGKISLWDNTGQSVLTIEAGNEVIRTLSWPVDGLLVSAGNEGAVRFWQLEAPQIISATPAPTTPTPASPVLTTPTPVLGSILNPTPTPNP